jgi:Fe-S-cluster containining protein
VSPCETCSSPGSCCRGFVLSLNDIPKANWESIARSRLDGYGLTYFRIEEALRSEVTLDGCVGIRCSCDKLDKDGRCGDYENRPNVCRVYEPLSDNLCAEFVGPSPYRIPEHVAYPA